MANYKNGGLCRGWLQGWLCQYPAPLQINNQFNWLLQSTVTNWFYLLGQWNGASPIVADYAGACQAACL